MNAIPDGLGAIAAGDWIEAAWVESERRRPLLPIGPHAASRVRAAFDAFDAFDATIVAGLIRMAHDLGKTATAEGVERVDQVASLRRMRCDAIQGWFAGQSLTAGALVAAPTSWRKTPGARVR